MTIVLGPVLRSLRRSPGFTAASLATLALGIGATAAVWSVVQAVLLEPLPYPDPGALVEILDLDTRDGGLGMVSPPNFRDWRAENVVFEEMALFHSREVSFTGDAPEVVPIAAVTPSLFSVLAVEPLLGRGFLPEEDLPGRDDVVVLGFGFWMRRFGGDADVLGSRIALDGRPCTVVGVLPRGFSFPLRETALWVPTGLDPSDEGERGSHWMNALARLKEGVSLEAAETEMKGIAGRLERSHPDSNTGWSVVVRPYHESVSGSARPTLLLFSAAVGVLLLIACANVANLLLARAVGRRREIALRAALGAGRARLVGDLLFESLLLAFVGGLVGVGAAGAAVSLLPRLAPEIPRIDEVSIDLAVVGFAAAVSFLSALAAGLGPAVTASRTALERALRESAGAPSRTSLQRAVIASQTALAFVLLVGGGLLVRSYQSLLSVDPGFPTAHLLSFRIEPPRVASPTAMPLDAFLTAFLRERDRAADYFDEIRAEIETIPGVRSVAAVNRLPLAGAWWTIELAIEGRPTPEPGRELASFGRVVTSGYFETMGVPLLGGRGLSPRDGAESEPVVVVDRALVQKYFPDDDALGARIRFPGDPTEAWRRVVGVVGDVHHDTLGNDPGATVYVPMRQAIFGFSSDWGMSIVARTDTDPGSLARIFRERVLRRSRGLPLFELGTMEERLSGTLAPQRFRMALSSLFAAVALALAALGIYGVASHWVRERTRELGVRIALGASSRRVLAEVLANGMGAIGSGLSLGVIGALLLGPFLESLLYRVPAADLTTFVAVGALVLGSASAALYVPARRASRVDPIVVLRDL